MSTSKLASFFETVRKFEDGTMDKYIERWALLQNTFAGTTLSACVVNADMDDMPIDGLGESQDVWSKYIDLSNCPEGDYNLFCRRLNQSKFDGLMIDNIDKIPDNEDREYWEEFVRCALKREDEFPLPDGGDNICFSKMHIAVRCKEIPEYLKGKSLQCVIIGEECHQKFLSDEDSI